MYVLQPYDGPSTRHTCPRCHQQHSFTLYVDESGAKIADNVGRCNHSSACGYRYIPKQYYADHPDLRHARLDRASQKPKPVPAKPKLLCTIPISYVNRSVRTDRDSNLKSRPNSAKIVHFGRFSKRCYVYIICFISANY